MKLVKTREHLNVRRNFFSKRVIDKWNGLSVYEVEATVTGHIKTDTKRLFTYTCNRDKLSISFMKLKKVFPKRMQKKKSGKVI